MPNQGGETTDNYPHVVVDFDDGCRVIECGAGIQWIVQTRQKHPRYPWVNQYFCRTKEALLHYSGHAGHPVLQALPDWFPEDVVRARRMRDLAFDDEPVPA